MKATFKNLCDHFKDLGFFLIKHRVYIHHALKDFKGHDLISYRFMIIPVGTDFLHVAIVKYRHSRDQISTQVAFTCAGDDLLYGLRVKYTNLGQADSWVATNQINVLLSEGNLKNHDKYVKQRFKRNRNQAKIRALLIMIKDYWNGLFHY